MMLPSRFNALVDDCVELAGKYTLTKSGEAFLKALTADASDITQELLTILLVGSADELVAFRPAALPMPAPPSLTLFDPHESMALQQFRQVARLPRATFPSGFQAPALQVTESTENITGAAWLRVLVAVELTPDSLTPAWADYLQQFVDILIVMPRALASPGPTVLATALNNTQSLALLLHDPACQAAALSTALVRALAVPLDGAVIEPGRLAGLCEPLRAAASARRCICVAERVTRELRFEHERVRAAQAVHTRPRAKPAAAPAATAPLGIAAVRDPLKAEIDAMLSRFGERAKVKSDVPVDALVGQFDEGALEWTEELLAEDKIVPAPDLSGTRPGSHEYTLNSGPEWRSALLSRVTRVISLRMKKDAEIAAELARQVQEKITTRLAPVAAGLALPHLTLPSFPQSDPGKVVETIQTNWGAGERLKLGGIMGVFSTAQGLVNKFLGLFMIVLSLWAFNRQDPTIKYLVLGAVVVVMIVLFRRMPIVERRQFSKVLGKLQAQAAQVAKNAMNSAEELRAQAFASTVDGWKTQLAAYWSAVDNLVATQAAAKAADNIANENAVTAASWVFSEKITLIDKAVNAARQCQTQLAPLADSAVKLAGTRFSGAAAAAAAANALAARAPTPEPAAPSKQPPPPPAPINDASATARAGTPPPRAKFPQSPSAARAAGDGGHH